MDSWSRDFGRGVREFCRVSSVHGLSYVADGPVLKALIWFVALVASFSLATIIIHAALEEFSVSKVITTVGEAELPIMDIQVEFILVLWKHARNRSKLFSNSSQQ